MNALKLIEVLTWLFQHVSWRRPRTLLIVDDDPLIREVMINAATKEGWAVKSAATADQARGILTANGSNFVWLLIDVNILGQNGWDLRREVMDAWPKLRVCMISGAAESFLQMPEGEIVNVMLKGTSYRAFMRRLG